MTSLAGLLILIISFWLCQIIDGIPEVFSGVSVTPWWSWLVVGSVVLSWLLKD
ncbi:MAG: hypothetical protein AAF821_04320 [Cyanobacteria bacterium P01_D01_bin.156]